MKYERTRMRDTAAYQIEEYKQVRAELMERERFIGQLAIVAFVSSATLISGLLGAFSGKNLTPSQLGGFIPYLMLAPLLVTIPIYFIVGSHRKDLFRAGAYLQVFYEEDGAGIGWQTRIQQFRAKKKGDSLDTLPLFFWSVAIICVFSSFMLKGRGDLTECTWLDLAILIAIFAVMNRADHLYSSAPKSHRKKCIDAWRAVKNVDHVATPSKKEIQ